MTQETTEWRQCKHFPRYEVSSAGLVRKEGRLRKLQFHPWGYTLVYLSDGRRQRKLYVHRLVAAAFLGEGGAGQEVDHINGDKTDNRAENLRWLTRAENLRTRRRRNSGLAARDLQLMGKFTSPTLDVDGRRAGGGYVENQPKPLVKISKACGSIIHNGRLPHRI